MGPSPDPLKATKPAEAFCAAAARYGDGAFLHSPPQASHAYTSGPIDYTYAQAGEAIATLRKGYADAGVGRGHRLGLALENRAEFFLHFLALNALGAAIVPLDPHIERSGLAHRIAHSGLMAIVTLPEHSQAMEAAARAAGAGIPVVTAVALKALGRLGPPPCTGAPEEGDDAVILYTSGTTGAPKGCRLSNAYFAALGRHYVQLGGYCTLETGAERLITPLPVTHMNALGVSSMAMIMTGGCLIQLDRFHPRHWWETVRESRASVFHYLGVMPAMLLGLSESPEDDVSDQVKFGFGAGVDPKHHATFEARFGVPLIEAWSMTETGAGAWITANREPRHVGWRCFGKAPAWLETRIVDDMGNELGEGKAGELLVRRAGRVRDRYFFSGYDKEPEATEEAWRGGWFHTGDIVRRDGEGSFFFVDRLKNIIRRSGENIAAVEVEGAILEHPAVAAAGVAPVRDEIRGEEVAALVVLTDAYTGNTGLAAEIAAFTRDRLAYFKAPGYLGFVDALPRTASEKIQRAGLKAEAQEMCESGKAVDLRHLKKRPTREAAP